MTPRSRIAGHKGARKGMGFALSMRGHAIPALSLTQPWAWAILKAGKDIENRTWSTRYTGPLWLHAAKTMRRDDYYSAYAIVSEVAPGKHHEMPGPASITRAAFVGLTWVTGCERNPDTQQAGPPTSWAFDGQFGWQLDLDRTWALSEPLPASGALGLWRPTDAETATLRARLPAVGRRNVDAWQELMRIQPGRGPEAGSGE